MSGTLRLNDTTFATETNGNITTNVSELKINDQTVIDSNKSLNVSDVKVGGNTVIDSNKSLNVSDVKVGGNTVIDSNRKMTGVDIVPTTNFTFRNKIINGNLKSARVINQRGATNSITGATGYTYDRWYYDGSTYLYQGIEDLNVNNGTYVISWEGDNLIAHWALEDDNDTTPPYTAGPDSALTWNLVSKNSTFTINESPEYGKHLWIRFSLDTGGDFANLDKVQVEEGTVATPFEHRPYGVELRLCQRYFQIGGDCVGRAYSSSKAECYCAFQTQMRTTPTVSKRGNGDEISLSSGRAHVSGFANYNISTLTAPGIHENGCTLHIETTENWGSGNILGIRGRIANIDAEL